VVRNARGLILRKPSYQVNSPRPQLSGLRGALQTTLQLSLSNSNVTSLCANKLWET
jgi:hypothetical protein